MPDMTDVLSTFRAYVAEGGGAMYPSRDEAQDTIRRLGLTNPATYYARLLAWLREERQFDVRPMREALVGASPEDQRVVVTLRHDMDTEPYSSLEAARALHAAGLPGSFYVLHTAEYYGQWHEEVFRRNSAIAPLLREMQDHYGCEIGLHTDGLWVYQRWQADGSQAIAEELAWLRSAGLSITGTAAHNSAPVYGAENFELFRGRSFRQFCSAPNGAIAPLQVLGEAALGLHYEANAPEMEPFEAACLGAWMAMDPADPVRDQRWMRTYLVDHPVCRWGADYNLWLVGRDRWAVGGHRARNAAFMWDACLDDVVRFIRQVPPRTRVVFHVHPLYIDFARA
jgi:peptidoglycan/xylan/chitin deacetylase (PgdA/CDA1 family)